jgi:phenylalanine-4-hydroxylase
MSGTFETNDILSKLPPHLYSLIIDQPYNDYTPQDHAVWRYVMRQNVNYLGKVAHKSYLDGLIQTGISVDSIPHMYGMNRILKEIGWAAVAVDGFIPPQAFMEFQAYKVLVIAADIRNINHIEYTPAPDIIHEAAGHAPIIADPEYALYLKRFGEIGAKAISSAKDHELYEAIRHLSIIKEDHNTPEKDIKDAEKHIEFLLQNMGEPSEMARLRNLHWWTVEYGLIGSPENYKIYGAGLLSSIGESINCMQPTVKKIPYSIAAADYSFDITNEQPQLFVTPTFEHLNSVLDEFSETMAFKKGGVYGLKLAEDSKGLITATLDSGLQISGLLENFTCDANKNPNYLKFSGPCQLSFDNKQLPAQGKEIHKHGYSTILGNPVGFNQNIWDLNASELNQYGIKEGNQVELVYPENIVLKGRVKTLIPASGKIGFIAITFTDCTIKKGETVLFKPEWGDFDLGLGSNVVSVFAGLADPKSYGFLFEPPKEKTHKLVYSDNQKALFKLYTEVRHMRENKQYDEERLKDILAIININHPKDWLLTLEIYELAHSFGSTQFKKYVFECLSEKTNKTNLKRLIENGLKLIDNNFAINYDNQLQE